MSAKVESIRPRAADAAPPARTPERQALADAIERQRETTAALERIEAARVKAASLRYAAEQRINDAQAAIDDARESAPGRLVDRLLSDDADTAGGDDPEASATAALARAEADERTAAEACALLDGQIAEARGSARLAEVRVGDRIAAVLQAEAFPQLIARLEALRYEVAAMSLIMGAVSRFAPMGYHYEAQRNYPDASMAGAHAWRDAVERLRQDAGAPLPAVTAATEPGAPSAA